MIILDSCLNFKKWDFIFVFTRLLLLNRSDIKTSRLLVEEVLILETEQMSVNWDHHPLRMLTCGSYWIYYEASVGNVLMFKAHTTFVEFLNSLFPLPFFILKYFALVHIKLETILNLCLWTKCFESQIGVHSFSADYMIMRTWVTEQGPAHFYKISQIYVDELKWHEVKFTN